MIKSPLPPGFQLPPLPDLPVADQETLIAETVYEDKDMTIAFVSINGLNKRIINHGSDNTYEVLKGDGILEINGVEQPLREGVVITVPKNTPYHDEGRLVLLATSVPAFNPSAIEYIK